MSTATVVVVNPRLMYVPTGIVVSPGERYRFTASGLWRDGGKQVDADGWRNALLQRFNRVRGAPFFCLCGCIGTDENHAFAIDRLGPWTVPAEAKLLHDHQLYLFANDWRCMYFNNHELPEQEGGPLRVEITRIE